MRRFQLILPELFVAGWLVFLAVAVWHRASEAEVPPCWDAHTYYFKAKGVWKVLAEHGGIKELLNVPPAVRPPGTVLVTYPFGFNPDFRPFLFRTVYFPILLSALAIFVAGWRARNSLGSRWLTAALAIAITTFGGFWHFDVPGIHSPLYWGLVDNFFATVAALSAAAGLRAAFTRSLGWAVVAVLLAVLCPLIKPVGLAVMATLLAGIWLALGLCAIGALFRGIEIKIGRQGGILDFNLRAFRHKIPWLPVALPFLVIVLSVGLAIAVILVCAHSDYFSPENFAFGKAAMQNLRSNWTPQFSQILATLVPALGYSTFLIFAGGIVAILGLFDPRNFCRLKLVWAPVLVALVYVVLAFLAGFYVWGLQFGFVEIRYSFPFFLIALATLAFLIVLKFGETWKRAARGLSILLVLPAANLGAMLLVENPAYRWQEISGVNITVHRPEETDRFVKRLVDTQLANKNLRVYFLSYDVGGEVSAFDSFLNFYGMAVAEKQGRGARRIFQLRPTNDWTAAPVIKLSELAGADFIVAGFVPSENGGSAGRPKDWQGDAAALGDWLAGRAVESGWVQKVAEIQSMRVFQVVDPAGLQRGLLGARRDLEFSGHLHEINRDFFGARKYLRGQSTKQLERARARSAGAVAN